MYEDDDFRAMLAKAIFDQTQGLTQKASIEFHGPGFAADIFDYICSVFNDNGVDMKNLGTAIEQVAGYALYIMYGLKFPDYRLGFDYSIQGMDQLNWHMTYTFSPQPKLYDVNLEA